MPDPDKYERDFSFEGFQSGNPTSSQPGIRIDDELDRISAVLDGLIEAVKNVRRSDGKLPNGSVTYDSLSTTVKSQLAFPSDAELRTALLSALSQPGTAIGDKLASKTDLISGTAVIDPYSFGRSTNFLGFISSGLADRIGYQVQMYCPRTASTASYEKDAIRGWAQTSDQSDAQAGKNFDAVGVAGYGWVAPDNPQGRAWGIYGEGRVQQGGDGLAYGAEISIYNGGSDQPSVGTPFSKYGMLVSIGGPNPSTAVMFITRAGTAQIHNGIVADPGVFTGAIGSSFLNLVGKFRVFHNGNVSIGFSPANASANLEVAGNSWQRGSAAAGALIVTTPHPTDGALGVTEEIGFITGGYGDRIFTLGGAERWRMKAGGGLEAPASAAGYVRTGGSTVAQLPAATTALRGARLFVTDAQAGTPFLGALTGGGTACIPVFCTGSAWVAG